MEDVYCKKCGTPIAEVDENGNILIFDNYCICNECERELCESCHGDGEFCEDCSDD